MGKRKLPSSSKVGLASRQAATMAQTSPCIFTAHAFMAHAPAVARHPLVLGTRRTLPWCKLANHRGEEETALVQQSGTWFLPSCDNGTHITLGFSCTCVHGAYTRCCMPPLGSGHAARPILAPASESPRGRENCASPALGDTRFPLSCDNGTEITQAFHHSYQGLS